MKEIRVFKTDGFSVETRGEGEGKIIRGHAALFDSLSENLGGFREKIDPGAFSDVLKDDVRALFNHDPNLILGRSLSGTLKVSQDSTGLLYEVDLPDTQYARDLSESIQRGDVDQSSFGFTVAEDDWDENDEGVLIRTIRKIKRLFDVSPVTYPAYPDTSVAKRSLEQYQAEHKPGNRRYSLRRARAMNLREI